MSNTVLTRATLSRYIAGRIIRALLLAFMIVTAIIMLVDFVEGSRNLGSDSNVSSFELLLLTLMKAPTLIEQTIPFVVLFGVMGALYNLNRRSELIVMRASGVSAWRFLRPVIYVTMLLGIGWALLFNPMASRLMAQHDSLRENFGASSHMIDKEIWLREGNEASQTVIRAEGLDVTKRTLSQATFYQLDLDGSGRTVFSRRFDAQSARLAAQGYWELTDVIENAPGAIKRELQTVSLPTQITQEQLDEAGEVESIPPFWSLPAAIKENEQAGFSALALRMQFNKLLALPIMLIAMTFIAAGVSMHLTRQGGTFRLLISGAALGFAVYFADSVVTAFGEVAIVPVVLAAWTVPLFVLLAGISYLAKVEDG